MSSFGRLVYGTWRLADGPEAKTLSQPENILTRIKTCMENGITTFDCADIYGDYGYEELFGKALALQPALRNQIKIVSKCGILYPCTACEGTYVKHYDLSKEYIIQQANRSLEKLGIEYLDLLLIHRPSPLMDPKVIAEAFDELSSSGKVKDFGVSNFTPSQFDMLQKFCKRPLIANQVEISVSCLHTLTDGTLDQCIKNGITPMAWSPLGGGSIFTGTDEKSMRLRGAMTEVGQELGGLTIDQVAYVWLLHHPSKISIVLGTNKVERIKSAAAITDTKMTTQQYFKILEASNGAECP